MLLPFLPTVKLYVENVPAASMIATVSPLAGEAGRVRVHPPPDVLARIPSPLFAEYVVDLESHVIPEPGSPEKPLVPLKALYPDVPLYPLVPDVPLKAEYPDVPLVPENAE